MHINLILFDLIAIKTSIHNVKLGSFSKLIEHEGQSVSTVTHRPKLNPSSCNQGRSTNCY